MQAFNHEQHDEADSTDESDDPVSVVESHNKDGSVTYDRFRGDDRVATVNVAPNETLRAEAFRDRLLDLSEYADGRSVNVISGYRSQADQDRLRTLPATKQVAATVSQHTVGLAADITITGMNARAASFAAYDSGLFNRVNLYPARNSVHVDMQPGVSRYYGVDWMKTPR